MPSGPLFFRSQFLSTLSLRRATFFLLLPISPQAYFYPRSPCGERPGWQRHRRLPQHISIHALLAESDAAARSHISIHALLAESDIQPQRAVLVPSISIHALLAESDGASRASSQSRRHFYPRSPCGERPTHVIILGCKIAFLSTLSLRRATLVRVVPHACKQISIHALLAESDRCRLARSSSAVNFYPRSPCGERRVDC